MKTQPPFKNGTRSQCRDNSGPYLLEDNTDYIISIPNQLMFPPFQLNLRLQLPAVQCRHLEYWQELQTVIFWIHPKGERDCASPCPLCSSPDGVISAINSTNINLNSNDSSLYALSENNGSS